MIGRAALAFLLLCRSALAAAEPLVLVTDSAALQALEKQGFSFSAVLGGAPNLDNHALQSLPAYRSLADSLSSDLIERSRQDRRLNVGMATGHRLFDARWLKSSAARFELVGLFNRSDRAPFAPSHCGETRLIYRLGYHTKSPEIQSRLPMTVNVVFWNRAEGDSTSCQALSLRWERSREIVTGPGGPLETLSARLKSVEINFQSVRWPSTIRPDMGGYAEYELRVFTRQPSGELALSPLENTPDLPSLLSHPALKTELLQWIRDNLPALDSGTAVIPEKFLAKKVTSVALHGSARLANRPFDQLFRSTDFAKLDFSRGRYVRSAPALLRRLNDLSCAGCHQGRTIAGFHFLGVDPADTEPGNAIVYSSSPHLQGDLARRLAFVTALKASSPDPARPFSEHADSETGGFGAACGLGDPSFAKWTCQSGLRCETYDLPSKAAVGRCYPETSLPAGSPCEVGIVTQTADPTRDRILSVRPLSCGGDRVCEQVAVGFPGGMCSGSCERLGTGEVCGAIAVLDPFNRCLARHKPFPECLRDNVRPGVQQKCREAVPCRDDYVCAKTSSGEGACIPPYFLFQLRADGHPVPPA